eukprot:scaffold111059_cov27-Tisochrysis_lutea.AAC.1
MSVSLPLCPPTSPCGVLCSPIRRRSLGRRRLRKNKVIERGAGLRGSPLLLFYCTLSLFISLSASFSSLATPRYSRVFCGKRREAIVYICRSSSLLPSTAVTAPPNTPHLHFSIVRERDDRKCEWARDVKRREKKRGNEEKIRGVGRLARDIGERERARANPRREAGGGGKVGRTKIMT